MAQTDRANRHILHDSLIKFYDDRASGYDSEVNSAGEVWHLTLAHDLVKAAIPFIPSFLNAPTKVLDLCCGTGMVAFSAYEQLGPTSIIHGVDFSPKSIEIAQAKAKDSPNFKFYVSSAHELDILDLDRGTYSLITCCSAFVLLSDGLTMLKAWAEYLAPGGIIALDVTAAGTQRVTDYLTHSLPTGSGIVDRRWIKSENSLRDLFIKAGYTAKEVMSTKVYKSWEYDVHKAEETFEKMIQAEIYRSQVEKLTKEEIQRTKDAFVDMMHRDAGSDGLLVDNAQLYIGIASKKV